MSRCVKENEKYTLAFGVDHTPMGCFFQLWEKAAEGENPEADETDKPQIEADEQFGLRIHHQPTVTRNRRLEYAIDCLREAPAHLRSEETMIFIGAVCELDIANDVFQLWN